MASVPLTPEYVVEDGGILINDVVFNDTFQITSKVALNRRHREKATILCYSPISSGILFIYDVDEHGNILLINDQDVTEDSLLIYSHNHITHGIYCVWEPNDTAGDDSDFIRVRAYFAGNGVR